MSGGGKRTALKMLEDVGFYCVDNLPVPLIEKFVELIIRPGGEIGKVALGLDVRADQPFNDAQRYWTSCGRTVICLKFCSWTLMILR